MRYKERLDIYNQKYDRYLNVYLMFVVAFLYHFSFIFQGLDAADFGYHMTHQVLSFLGIFF
jgi:hypothetical protein